LKEDAVSVKYGIDLENIQKSLSPRVLELLLNLVGSFIKKAEPVRVVRSLCRRHGVKL